MQGYDVEYGSKETQQKNKERGILYEKAGQLEGDF